MKRPLLIMGVAFVLGEVLGILGYIYIIAGVLFGMSVFCVVIKLNKVNRAKAINDNPIINKEIIILFVMFVFAGLLNNFAKEYINPSTSEVIKELSNNINKCQIYGKISDIEVGSNSTYLIIKTFSVEVGGKVNKPTLKIKVKVDDYKKYKIGQKIYINGIVSEFEEKTNPGGFDNKKYNYIKGILYVIYKSDIQIINSKYNKYLQGLRYIREKIYINYFDIMQADNASLTGAMVLGEKSNLNKEIKALYQKNGIAHLLAISGLHIAFFGIGLFKLLRKIGMSYLTDGIIVTVFVISYGLMSGYTTATIRAMIMVIILIIAEIIGRSYDSITAMSLALIIILILNPAQIFEMGFVLSFAAVIGVCLGNYIGKLVIKEDKSLIIKKRRTSNKKELISSKIYITIIRAKRNVITAVVIFLVTAPIIVYYIYEIPPYSIILNILLVPLMSIGLPFGLIGGIVSCFSLKLAAIIVIPMDTILTVYERVCSKVSTFPLASIIIGKITITQIALYYIVLASIIILIDLKYRDYSKNKNEINIKHNKQYDTTNAKIKMLVVSLIGIIIICTISNFAIIKIRNSYNVIVVIDVGQGDGILIKDNSGVVVFIDGGTSTNNELAKYTLVPALKYYGISEIDYAIITHPDIDHYSGILEISENRTYGVKIKNILMWEGFKEEDTYKKIKKIATDNNINFADFNKGNYIKTKSLTLKCIHPDDEIKINDLNQGSIVISLESDKINMLFTGDIDSEIEKRILETKELCHTYNYLKVAHHGSSKSSCSEFLEKINCAVAIISCGKNNRYKHPSGEVLERLINEDYEIIRTDKSGAVIIKWR